MQEVSLPAVHPEQLRALVAPGRMDELLPRGEALAQQLAGTAVVSVNSTASGGGVAEMLSVLLPYARGVGIDARWLVIEGDERFFAITKRLHNHVYGTPGDGGPLAAEEHDHYRSVMRENAAELATAIRPGDVVILHDPQTAGLADDLRARGAAVLWRCHIGTDTMNAHTDVGWSFLERYVGPSSVDGYVFSRAAFAPPWMPPEMVHEIPPSIDPFSPKNQDLDAENVRTILTTVGLLAGPSGDASYMARDGTPRRVIHGADIVRTGPPPDPEAPLVLQVSRWDRLKDMAGVLAGFADYVVRDHGAQLVLAGPVVTAVADDPEGAEVLVECYDAWRHLPHHARQRVTLACIPMADPEENAIIVNALQRHAAVVVQKSFAEGFGLTVSEAMYKSRPVIASAVGGIADQVVHGETGLLLDDPADLEAFAGRLESTLGDPEWARSLGANGRKRVVDRFLPDSQLLRWAAVLGGLPDSEG